MQRRMPERESAARRPPHSKNPQDYLKPILAKQPDRVKGIRGRSLASTHERGEGVGGARRNRTADNGFADHCLTTWRPRHRTEKLSVLSNQLSVISQKKNAPKLPFCARKLLVMNSPFLFRMVFGCQFSVVSHKEECVNASLLQLSTLSSLVKSSPN